jgi:hypothetical protein
MMRRVAQLHAAVWFAVLCAMLTFLVCVWFAPPADATRPTAASYGTRDYCANLPGVQPFNPLVWRVREHPVTGVLRCKLRTDGRWSR